MDTRSVTTRGRTLDHAAFVYDLFEPILMLGKMKEYNRQIISLLDLKGSEKVLDLGCGTGVLTRMVADRLNGREGGLCIGIDAAARMIDVARKKRESETCRFEVAAAENLPFADNSFDAVISSLFFHHVPQDLKEKALSEAFRVLRPRGKLIIADMHTPSTWMGKLVSHASRWFFLQAQIGENIKGILPDLIKKTGFLTPKPVFTHFGYITTFLTSKPEADSMNVLKWGESVKHQGGSNAEPDPFKALEEELSSALSRYWSAAARILQGSGIHLIDPGPALFSLENNFFSMLFLYSYHRLNIPQPRRILYATVNQCLRGMVTGCDNLLDDEYKKTIDTDLPMDATRFRSVLDMMVSDRVLFQVLVENWKENGLTPEQVIAASAASLRALARSGAQEASEEKGNATKLPPGEILSSVHHYKTGILFQSPWAVPAVIENLEEKTLSPLLGALYRIGMGCQVLDDMVDLARDMRQGRHNYVASLIYHESDSREKGRLEEWVSSDQKPEEKADLLFKFPGARASASRAARNLLREGTTALFAEKHQCLVDPAIQFLIKRIGAERFMSSGNG